MTPQACHCPFLNRTDDRCSNRFSLDSLGHAFAYCFGQYQQCPVYDEMLAERQERRSHVPVAASPVIEITLHGRVAHQISTRQHQRAA